MGERDDNYFKGGTAPSSGFDSLKNAFQSRKNSRQAVNAGYVDRMTFAEALRKRTEACFDKTAFLRNLSQNRGFSENSRFYFALEEKMTIILVMDNDCAIGKNGNLLYRLPEDMKHFRATTENCAVVMGRKTYESFPKRPLPNRENIVISRTMKSIDGAGVFGDIKDLLSYLEKLDKKVFVIGGGEIYHELLPYCDEAIITRVYENFGGDVFFEDIEHDGNFELAESSPLIETNGKIIRFMKFLRKTGG